MPTAKEVEKQFAESFPTIPVPDAHEIIEIKEGDYVEREEIQRAFGGKQWTDMKLDELLYHSDSLFFLTPVGFRYYLPAYILSSLDLANCDRILDTVIFALTPGEKGATQDRFEEFFDALNQQQRTAVCLYLAYLVENAADGFSRNGPKQLLDGYWSGAVHGERDNRR